MGRAPPRTCSVCGVPISSRANRKTCGPACCQERLWQWRQAHGNDWRRRHRERMREQERCRYWQDPERGRAYNRQPQRQASRYSLRLLAQTQAVENNMAATVATRNAHKELAAAVQAVKALSTAELKEEFAQGLRLVRERLI